MNFTLFLNLKDVELGEHGPFVNNPETDDRVDYYRFENGWDDVDLFENDIDSINQKCGTLLGYGDLDYFDAKKCVLLKEWLTIRMKQPMVPRYEELLEVLYNFCERAIIFNTGVRIDL